MLGLLLYILILALVFAFVYWVVGILGLPSPINKIVLAILAIIFLVLVLGAVFGALPMPQALYWPHR